MKPSRPHKTRFLVLLRLPAGVSKDAMRRSLQDTLDNYLPENATGELKLTVVIVPGPDAVPTAHTLTGTHLPR